MIKVKATMLIFAILLLFIKNYLLISQFVGFETFLFEFILFIKTEIKNRITIF